MNQEKARDWAVGPDEMPLLWRQLDELEDRVRRSCWLVMLLTGLRSGDARSMKWENLDQDGVLTVPSPKGGEAKAFKLPLPRFLVQELGEVRDLTKPLESPYVLRVSDLLCMSNLSHASILKEHDNNDDFQGRSRRTA